MPLFGVLYAFTEQKRLPPKEGEQKNVGFANQKHGVTLTAFFALYFYFVLFAPSW